MRHSTVASLVDVIGRYDRVVEVGIGHRPDVAAALASAGVTVTATDIHPRPVPYGVRFVEDDIVARAGGDAGPYADADAIYALNLPPELHRPTRDVARAVGADFLFTTLGGDQPAIPVERMALDEETLYIVRQ